MRYTILDNKTQNVIECATSKLSTKKLCDVFEFDFSNIKKSKFGFGWYVIGKNQTIFFEIH